MNNKKLGFSFLPNIRGLKIQNEENLFPVARIFCIAKNYIKHADEMQSQVEENEPYFFSKYPESITQVEKMNFPHNTELLHHEVELVVFLKDGGKNIPKEKAKDCIFGYAVGVDLTKRDLQFQAIENGNSWEISKSFFQSAPISKIKQLEGEIISNKKIILSINGEEKQSANIDDMVWKIDDLISFLSKYNTLKSGDIIFTGTPEGVGAIDKGDTLNASIEDIGEMQIVIQ